MRRYHLFCQNSQVHIMRRRVAQWLLFLAVLFGFGYALGRISAHTAGEQEELLEQMIWRGITQCYVMEGSYPESLEYLEDAYGVSYDTDRYFVDYQVWGSNIVPEVTIIEKQ